MNANEQKFATKLYELITLSNGQWKKPWKISPKQYNGTEKEFGNKAFKRGFYHGMNAITTELHRMVYGLNSRVFLTSNDIETLNGYEWEQYERTDKKTGKKEKAWRKVKKSDTGLFIHLKKGCHGCPILTYVPKKEKLDENGELIDDGEFNFFVAYNTVYNSDDLVIERGNFSFDSYQPKMPTVEGDGLTENEIEKEVLAMYKKNPPSVIHTGDQAFYREYGNIICIPNEKDFYSREEYLSTLFHELTHSTGISDKLDRECYRKYHQSRKWRAEEELVAEIGACIWCGHYGLDEVTVKNSAEYITNWDSDVKENPNIFFNAFNKAIKAYEFIIGTEGK